MGENEIELFLHIQGEKSRVVKAGLGETLGEVLTRSGALKDGASVFVGQCEEGLHEALEIEEGTDSHAPADLAQSLEALELRRHRHVHVHHCRRIAVEVHFGGDTKRHKFSPATTIAVVTQWARRKFRLEGAAGNEYVLQICETTNQPRSDEHLSQVVHGNECSICFDLVKEVTPQGAPG